MYKQGKMKYINDKYMKQITENKDNDKTKDNSYIKSYLQKENNDNVLPVFEGDNSESFAVNNKITPILSDAVQKTDKLNKSGTEVMSSQSNKRVKIGNIFVVNVDNYKRYNYDFKIYKQITLNKRLLKKKQGKKKCVIF